MKISKLFDWFKKDKDKDKDKDFYSTDKLKNIKISKDSFILNTKSKTKKRVLYTVLLSQKRYSGDYMNNMQICSYISDKIKNASKEAGILMKKLAKLYSITPDDKSEVTTENIVDWKRWYKLMSENNPKKIVIPKK